MIKRGHKSYNLHQNALYLQSILIKTDKVMAQTSMTVRIDSQQKAMFDSLCEQFGMSANAAINVFIKAVIRTRSIPFSIKAKETKAEDEVTAKAREVFERARLNAEKGITPELSLDEINAEIREVRRLRKERNGVRSY